MSGKYNTNGKRARRPTPHSRPLRDHAHLFPFPALHAAIPPFLRQPRTPPRPPVKPPQRYHTAKAPVRRDPRFPPHCAPLPIGHLSEAVFAPSRKKRITHCSFNPLRTNPPFLSLHIAQPFCFAKDTCFSPLLALPKRRPPTPTFPASLQNLPITHVEINGKLCYSPTPSQGRKVIETCTNPNATPVAGSAVPHCHKAERLLRPGAPRRARRTVLVPHRHKAERVA